MQRSIDTIVLLNDTEHQPVERTSRYQKLHSIFQWNGKHFFYINSTINCSLIQSYQRYYVLGTGAQPYHNLCGDFCLCWIPSFPSASARLTAHIRSLREFVDAINVKELFIRKENSHGMYSFGKSVRSQFSNFFHSTFESLESNDSTII